jgi:hypothetical protein
MLHLCQFVSALLILEEDTQIEEWPWYVGSQAKSEDTFHMPPIEKR